MSRQKERNAFKEGAQWLATCVEENMMLPDALEAESRRRYPDHVSLLHRLIRYVTRERHPVTRKDGERALREMQMYYRDIRRSK